MFHHRHNFPPDAYHHRHDHAATNYDHATAHHDHHDLRPDNNGSVANNDCPSTAVVSIGEHW
ncbi:MAG: hypothetical protein O6834_03310 [Actinobacteria bacterium]|nr:hypothetical protein [Actinomycetota bacterium]